MDPTVTTYIIYLAISIGLTIWVARTLFRNGRRFLLDVYQGDESLADSVNHLLVVGFYLINLGFVTFALKLGVGVQGMRQAFEVLSTKVGTVLVVLGAMHFMNLWFFGRMRSRALQDARYVAKLAKAGPQSAAGA